MRFLLSTGSLYTYGLERCFDLAAQTGFDGMELLVDPRWDTRQPAYVRQLVERFGLPVVVVHSPFAFHMPGWPQAEEQRVQKSLGLARKLGAERVVAHLPLRTGRIGLQLGRSQVTLPWPGWRGHESYRRWLDRDYPAFQAATPISLCLENMPAHRWLGRDWNFYHWNHPTGLARFPNLTMDTTHLGTWGLDPVEFFDRLAGHIRHVHLSNFDGREHRRPQDGVLSLDRLLQRLAQVGFSGTISLETSPDALDAGKRDARVVARLSESLAACRQWGAIKGEDP